MRNNLENLTSEEYINPEYLTEGSNYQTNFSNPHLTEFTGNIKNKKRKEELEQEINRLYRQYFNSLKSGAPGRAAMLEHSYNLVPDEEELEEGKYPKEVLEKRLYATPGRHYQYINSVVGDKKKSRDIKGEIGKAAKYTLKEGWPILGAGAGWLLANNWYNKNKGSPLKRANKAFDNKWYQYLGPKGVIRFGADAGKFAMGEGLRKIWSIAKTPTLYALGAYAAYKVVKYLLNRRKEKKLEQEEIERLENIRNNMLTQKQMFYDPRQMEMQIEEAA